MHAQLYHSSLFVAESDRWLTCLCSYLNSNSRPKDLRLVSRCSLPPATLAYLYDSHGRPDLDHIVEVGEWCLVIVAWSAGIDLSHLSISARSLDIVCLAILTGEGLGEVLVNWKRGCEEFVRTRMIN